MYIHTYMFTYIYIYVYIHIYMYTYLMFLDLLALYRNIRIAMSMSTQDVLISLFSSAAAAAPILINCSTLQQTATNCIMLQHAATRCNTL